MENEQKVMIGRIAVSALLTIGAGFLPDSWSGAGVDSTTRVLHLLPYLAAYLIISYDILKKAVKNIRKGQVLDENFLMAVASLGAFGLGIYQNADFAEAVAVMLFYQVGELFEDYAVDKSRRNISDLMDIRPDYANVEKDGQLVKVDPDEVAVGTVIVVQPGEKVPIDGIVEEGRSTLETAALTGESLPREVEPGTEVISGCINQSGVLKIRTTKEFGESTVSKILDLVEDASSRKSKSEVFITKFARIYTPVVCGAALALFLLPPVVRMAMGLPPVWHTWLYRSLLFLVVSCPCALVLSIPLSFFAGIGGASRQGILIKGSNYMETLAHTAYVVMDKTGTLTEGVFEVSALHHNKLAREHVLEMAALAECASSHPISKSLQKAYGKPIDRSRVTDIEEISGKGVLAKVDGHSVAAGNYKLMEQLGIPYMNCHMVGTLVHVAIDGEYQGHILIADRIKEHSEKAVRALKENGVKEVVMLTGDAKKAADAVAAQLGIDTVYSELLPQDKVEKVEELLRKKDEKDKVAFVGDGINDAPVLAMADVGIAMGALGSDAAIEAADVVLMDDDPLKISTAIRIARKCVGIVYQNIVFAIGIKVISLVLGALGFINMWFAIFADTGVLILCVLNSMRCLMKKSA
ncbi:heavy metal translocating P-type ATPase [Acidaminococcus timonensis]|uniref:heavy metal translocating P-type ATPase n=1 Tax=Acidaminococcus timonensis TaxID=1871002 RepID=UPI0026F3523B|nr:heavy metal translocating P-type ATPase [Acidaminococcus timonensis]